MEITVKLPDNIAQHANPGREALEALVIEGYCAGALSSYESRMLLGVENRFEFDGFLKDRNVEAGAYGLAEYEQDLKVVEELGKDHPEKRSA